jgi:hypothetical protein
VFRANPGGQSHGHWMIQFAGSGRRDSILQMFHAAAILRRKSVTLSFESRPVYCALGPSSAFRSPIAY